MIIKKVLVHCKINTHPTLLIEIEFSNFNRIKKNYKKIKPIEEPKTSQHIRSQGIKIMFEYIIDTNEYFYDVKDDLIFQIYLKSSNCVDN